MPFDAPAWIIKVLLVLHALVAFASIGATTHLLVVVERAARGPFSERLARLYPTVVLATWSAALGLGTVIYPAYRIRVRAEYLDAHARWAVILFDVKENLGVLVAPLLVALVLLSRKRETQTSTTFRVCAWASASVLWFDVIAGLIVVSVRSV
jgi:hypothetical protein